MPVPHDAPRPPRLRLGHVEIDAVTLAGAVDAVERLVEARQGGVVVTPNIDHVVRADRDAAFREAYAAADLSLADGQPIVWSSRVLGTRLPEKVSGADLLLPLMRRAAARGASRSSVPARRRSASRRRRRTPAVTRRRPRFAP